MTNLPSLLSVVIVFVIILSSVILHELAHGVTAYWLGDDTARLAGRLTFNPLKHIDPYMSILVPVILYLLGAPVFGGAKPVPVNFRNLRFGEYGMAIVAVSGPLTNFLLALISFLIGHYSGLLYGTGGELGAFVFTELIFINLGFLIFNLIPIPPLDGSRVLYALAPDGFRNLLANLERYGVIIVYLLIICFGEVFSSFMVGSMNGILNFFYHLVS